MQTNRHLGRSSVRRSRTVLAAGVVAGLLALSGCGASGGASDSSTKSDKAVSADERSAVDSGAAKAAQGPQEAGGSTADPKKSGTLPAGTHVIRTATLSVEVKSVPRAASAARSAAESAGGLVAA